MVLRLLAHGEVLRAAADRWRQVEWADKDAGCKERLHGAWATSGRSRRMPLTLSWLMMSEGRRRRALSKSWPAGGRSARSCGMGRMARWIEVTIMTIRKLTAEA